MKNTADYSDELIDLKQLHEENISRKFSDEEFNEIFNEAVKMETGLFKRGQRFVDEMQGMLMILTDATNQWEKERLVKHLKGNPKVEIKKKMADLEKVIEHFASKRNPDWGDVATLAHIHESLGEQLHEKYDRHTGYSRTIDEGMKRHTEALQNLWLQAESKIEKLDPKKHLPELSMWRTFLTDLMSGFQGILIQVGSQQITSDLKKNVKLPLENSLRQEAIELARKLGDEELVAYLKNTSMKSIHRRIQALREEVTKKNEKITPNPPFQ